MTSLSYASRDAARRSHRPSRVGGLIRRTLGGLERRAANPLSLLILILCGIAGYLQAVGNVFLVSLLFCTLLFEFQKRLDQGLPLMQIAALLAALQWCVGPMLAFATGMHFDRYSMYVEESVYFSFALPGTAAFALGLLAIGSSVRQREMLRNVSRKHYVTIGLILNATALLGRFLAPGAPGALGFAFHLVSQLGYVGTLYFLFSRHPLRWVLIALSLLPLFRQTAASAMFHDLLLWLGILFCFWYGLRRHSAGGKVALLIFTGLALFSIQAVKQTYRSKVWGGQDASFTEEIVQFWTTADELKREEIMPNVIMRLNQGWIISAVMNNVPRKEPYANGETIVEAVMGALVPRFIWQDKAKSGGQENFRRFTGLPLANTTSMAISPLGEAYANFGREKGILVMLVFGTLFASFYAFCLRWTTKHPSFLFWLPIIFYQAIKAETEFITVLNQLSKGAIIAFGVYWLLCIKIFPDRFLRAPSASKPVEEPKASAAPKGEDIVVPIGSGIGPR